MDRKRLDLATVRQLLKLPPSSSPGARHPEDEPDSFEQDRPVRPFWHVVQDPQQEVAYAARPHGIDGPCMCPGCRELRLGKISFNW